MAQSHVKDPILRLAATGEDLFLDSLELLAGEYVDIDFATPHTVVKNDGTKLYDKVRRPGSVWWQLPAGSSTVELRGTTDGDGIALDVNWRDAWA